MGLITIPTTVQKTSPTKACKSLNLKRGEMSEWLKEHAWKLLRPTHIG
jgi:hypothetical protein